jgi:NADH-quinone oxidoreductase subunit H
MPEFVTPQLVVSLVVILIMIHLLAGAAAYLILLERKVCAWVQDRLGPNRVGPMGLLQPIADAIKLLVKEDYVARGADRGLLILAPALTAITALISFAVIPWAGELQAGGETVRVIAADVNIGIIYLIAVASLGVYGVVLGGWASNNKYSFFGGLRASAQMVSYEIPLGLALVTVILTAGTVRPYEIISLQLDGQWFILHQPVAALLFYVCMLAETNRTPFDLAEAEAELVGGWHTEYSSMKWTLFFLGEYIHIVVGSAFFALLFLGGWSLNPFTAADLPVVGGLGMILLQSAVVLGKVTLIIGLTMAIRWTVPRFRFDQLMRLAWQGMIPTGLLLLLVTSLFVFMGWMPWMWTGSLAAAFVVWLVQPLMPKSPAPNRRVPLIGSRFSPLRETAEPGGQSESLGAAPVTGPPGVSAR